MSLVEYRHKRNFRKTPEPAGKRPPSRSGRLYVVQKHDASHLHYDFRLQLGDVLKSWAVPKGPSLDPSDKRLAIEVEDHPVEYGSFEGIIPAGEYGGGTVMLWDRGEWTPLDDPEAAYRAGKLKFELHGEKLRGIWTLVRRGGVQSSGKPQWFLIKHRDDEAREKEEFDVAAEAPLSVASGRDLDEIASDRDKTWGRSDGNGRVKQSRTRRRGATPAPSHSSKAATRSPKAVGKSDSQGARKRRTTEIPAIIQPELATLVKQPPSGDQWCHEIKFDGYRIICHVAGDKVRFQTRNELDWTAKMPGLAEAVRRLKLQQAILDGEIVVFDNHGASEFQLLQNAFREGPGKIVYMVFDLLFFKGNDLRQQPLDDRKELLASLKLPTDRGAIRYAEHFLGDGEKFLDATRRQGLEGIISKRRDRPYLAGRTLDWLKSKTHQTAEFVIGGFTDPAGNRKDFGAVLVGYHNGPEQLRYAGRVGTGFDAKTLGDLLRRLKPLAQDDSPFADFPERGHRIKGVHWIRPELVAQVEFSNWTGDQRLRHPSFQGLREDKPAREVTREIAKSRAGQVGVPALAGARPRPRGYPGGTPTRSRPARSVKSAETAVIEGVKLTHPDKLLYPADGITKRELADYYLACADKMLPHVVGRPLTIIRCPNGIGGPHFLQKHLGATTPEPLRRIAIREKRGEAEYCVVENSSGLVALAQIAALEIHVWESRIEGGKIDMLERPDRLVFDLDPAPDVEWPRVIAGAIEIRDFLRELKLESFVKTSGGKGLHLVVPIVRRQTWDAAKGFCRLVAQAIERAAPERYISTMSKKARTGKIFIDYQRNERGATAVAAFSTRAKPGAPVSLPISWRELPRTTGAAQFHLRDVLKRLAAERRDPWAGFADLRQSISAEAVRELSRAPAATVAGRCYTADGRRTTVMEHLQTKSFFFAALALWLTMPRAAPAANVADERSKLDAAYAADLEKLAVRCEGRSLATEAEQTRAWLVRRNPGKLYIFILPDSLAEPANLAANPDRAAWWERFIKLRRAEADALYELAGKALAEHRPALAYELIRETIREFPDHEQARGVLGHEKHDGRWVSSYAAHRAATGQIYDERFGWLAAANVARYERGERKHNGAWISADKDAALHSAIKSGWKIETEHYLVTTDRSLEAGARLAAKLERLNEVWRQVFVAYYMPEVELAKRYRGAPLAQHDTKRHQVVLFRDREEFEAFLKPFEPMITAAIAYYHYRPDAPYSPLKPGTFYSFVGQGQDEGTFWHEPTHQLFWEARATVRDLGQRENFWVVEAVACYMESLVEHGGYCTVGGPDAGRVPAAIERITDGFYVPLSELTRLSGNQIQHDSRIAKLYSESAGLADFLMHYRGDQYRQPLIDYLIAVYSGHADPDTLAKLTGAGYDKLDQQYREYMHELAGPK